MSVSSNFSTRFLTKSNIDDGAYWTISNVDVPDSGSYAVTVTIRGIDCFTGCGITSNSCSDFNKGKPFFRRAKTLVNTRETPNSIYIVPQYVQCL